MENKKAIENVNYNVLEKDKIKDYVVGIAKKEWSGHDFVKYGDDLYKSEWVLDEVKVSDIRPNLDLLKTEKFQTDLQPRIKKIKEILQKNQPIPPLILRGSDFLIFDGYARFHVLKERECKKCLAYVSQPINNT